MPLNAHHKHRQGIEPLGLDGADGIVDILLFLQQVLAEEEHPDVALFCRVFIALVQPFFVMVQIFLVFRSVRVVETHRWDFMNLFNLDLNLKVFGDNIVEHRCQVIRGRIHPVGIDLHPVLEILCFFGNQRQHGAHYFQQLHVAVKRILIAPLHQHFCNFLDNIGHSAAVTRNHITAHFGHLHHFRHRLVCKNNLCLRLVNLLLQPVGLHLELNQGGKNTIGIADSFGCLRVLMLKILIGPLGQFSVLSNLGRYLAPYPLVTLLHPDNSGNSDFFVHRITIRCAFVVVLTGLQNVIKSPDVN